MRNPALTILLLWLFPGSASPQLKIGAEYYTYIQQQEPLTPVPLVYFQTSKSWYAELRYNYEELQTFSIYLGKNFSGGENFSYSFTPIAGRIMGDMNGYSIGLNTDLEYKKLFFSSQSQYSASVNDRHQNFFFAWSELGYKPLKWFYAGVALQNTHVHKTNAKCEPGLLVGLEFDRLSVPVYALSPASENRYFIIGINFIWSGRKKTNSRSGSTLHIETP
jgi:hypothetical protein